MYLLRTWIQAYSYLVDFESSFEVEYIGKMSMETIFVCMRLFMF